MQTKHPYLEKVLQWAQTEDAIRAVVITGSMARHDGSIDEFSDLDLHIIATDIKQITDDDSWLDQIGQVWIRFPLHKDVPYRLVWFASGRKVDFQFSHLEDIKPMLLGGQLSEEYLRGYQVVLDKDALFRDLPPSPRIFPQPDPPSAESVQATINEFWLEAVHVAQFIRRREFWVVKHRDWTMKCDLLRLLEWHTRATHSEPINTWMLGKRIAQWTDDETRDDIKRIWSRWDASECWASLLLQIGLFSRISAELTHALGYDYVENTYREIEAYIRNLRDADRQNDEDCGEF